MRDPQGTPGRRFTGTWMLLLLLLAGVARGAGVEVSVDRNPVPLDESFHITFSISGEFPGQPDFSPLEKEFQVLGTSHSLRTTFVNGRMERRDRYLVSVMARRAGKVTIPPVSFGGEQSPPLEIRVVQPAPGTASPAGREVFMEVSADSRQPWLQQQVILTVRIFHRVQWRQASLSSPRFRGGEVLVEKLGEDRSYQSVRDGVTWQVVERRYALFPQASGRLTMDPLVLDLRVPGKRKPARQSSPFNDPFFDSFFSRQETVRKVVRSEPLVLEVKPVPKSFHGRHWLPAKSVKLVEKWSAPLDRLEAGRPVTRTLELTVDGVTLGQLPELTMPEVQGLRIYPDEPVTREQPGDEGVRATALRKFAIVPLDAGEYRVPEVTLRWWNVVTGREETVRLPAHLLRVAAGAPAGQTPAAPAGTPTAPRKAAGQAPGPSPVSGPLPGLTRLETGLLAAIFVLLLLWLATLAAWLRARRRGSGRAPARERPEKEPPPVEEREAWRRLHRAAAAGEAEAMRDALLAVSALLWPEEPPRSLEALARRVPSTLAEEVLALSRQLYGHGEGGWDGAAMEEALKRLAKEKRESPAAPAEGLRPLYPA